MPILSRRRRRPHRAPWALLLFLLWMAPDARAVDPVCTHEYRVQPVTSTAGVKFFFTDSTPFLVPVPERWAVEACFVVANLSGAPAAASVTLTVEDGVSTVFNTANGQVKPIPGGHPITCNVNVSDEVTLTNVGPIPAGKVTHRCCFDTLSMLPGNCADLPNSDDIVSVQLVTNLETVASDEEIDDVILFFGGSPCGLIGIEAVPFVAWIGLRRSRRYRRWRGASS